RIAATLVVTALSVAIVPFIHAYHRFQATSFPLWSAGILYFLPCIGFGLLFGMMISSYAERWGRDVGIFSALNTAGSGFGILAATFVLFTFDKDLGAWVLAAGLLLFVPFFLGREGPASLGRRQLGIASAIAVTVFVSLLMVGLAQSGPVRSAQMIQFFGSDGVVEVTPDRRVLINGLEHSLLYRDDDERMRASPSVKRKLTIALLPYLAHAGEGPKEVLNIGMGTGATARTLAKSPSVERVDAYEIVRTVGDVILAFPKESLGLANHDKIRVWWEDARAGLRRRDQQYDIITQSPLYLDQAGSSFLLSKQYLELVRSRLKEGGIAGIYCNSMGNAEQALIVRTTVSEVFEHYESFGRGYFILASDRPIDLSLENLRSKLVPGDPISEDIRLLGVEWVSSGFDRPRLDWESSPYLVTDDHPLIEWPNYARWLLTP
ncbi:MAG: fused MFS/spermidine synthase, partial [Acidobacteriota bacterium]